MDLRLSAEQRAAQELARTFAEREIAPRVLEYQRTQTMPHDIVRRMAEVGLLGGMIPLEYGGSAMDHLTFAICQEEISRVDHALGQVMANPSGMAGTALLRFGTEEQRQRFLVPLARGETFMGIGITEPHSGTEAAKVETRAVRQGDHYVLNGTKVFVSFSDLASSFVTFATTDPAAGRRGVTAFIVERGSPGFTTRRFTDVMFSQVTARGELTFQDCLVPAANVLGGEGRGFHVMTCALNHGRLAVASRMTGLAQGCLDAALRYARERIVFGQPIGRFQLVQGMLTDMLIGVRTSRLLYWELAWLLDQGNTRLPMESAAAKLYASDVAFRVATHAVQIHGAYGLTAAYGVERRFRDAKAYQIGEGNNEFLRQLIAEFALGFRDAGRAAD
jgi:alkylation response protein AidB-like acyl-CoA dehydrogenase